MPKAPVQTIESTAELLEEACRRNLSIELHRPHGECQLPAARGRLVAVEDDCLKLEEPETLGREVQLASGLECMAYVKLQDEMYVFETSILETHCFVRLNESKRVPGISISRPTVIKRGQRRQYFRTTLVGSYSLPASLYAATESEPVASLLDGPRYHNTLLADASEGGVSVVVPDVPSFRFDRFQRFFVRFPVPEPTVVVEFLGEVRSLRELHDGRDTRLGLMSLPWPSQAFLTRTLRPLSRFLTDVQRSQRR